MPNTIQDAPEHLACHGCGAAGGTQDGVRGRWFCGGCLRGLAAWALARDAPLARGAAESSDQQDHTEERTYTMNEIPTLYPPEPSLIDRIRQHNRAQKRRSRLCTFCAQEEGNHNDWSFLCCETCYPELSARLERVVREYEAEVRARPYPATAEPLNQQNQTEEQE